MSVLSQDPSGQNPTRKPDLLRPRGNIAEHEGLGPRAKQRQAQRRPRAYVAGGGPHRLSMSVFSHLVRRGGSFASSVKLGGAAF